MAALEQLGGQKTCLACQLCTRPRGSELTPTLNVHMAEAHPEGASSLRDVVPGGQPSVQMFRYTSLCQQGPWRMRASSSITRIPDTRQKVMARMTLRTAKTSTPTGN